MIHIVHDDDADGRVAAWVCEKWCKDNRQDYVLFRSTDRTKLDINPTSHDRIIIVDLSFTEEICDKLNKICLLNVIDHHKTSQWLQNKSYGYWNDKLAGCELAWEYFYQRIPKPPLVAYVGDRDLWEFELPDSKAVNTYIDSRFDRDDYMSLVFINDFLQSDISKAAAIGNKLLEYMTLRRQRFVREAVPFYFNDIKFINNTGDISDTLHEYLKFTGDKVVGSYWVNHKMEAVCSLRGIGEVDCSEIAARYGGGGHFNAAGFKINIIKFFEGCIELIGNDNYKFFEEIQPRKKS